MAESVALAVVEPEKLIDGLVLPVLVFVRDTDILLVALSVIEEEGVALLEGVIDGDVPKETLAVGVREMDADKERETVAL